MVPDSESKRRLKMSTAEFLEKPYSNISHRRNLQNEIATLYGRDIAKETRRIEATRIKKKILKNVYYGLFGKTLQQITSLLGCQQKATSSLQQMSHQEIISPHSSRYDTGFDAMETIAS